MRHCSVHNLQRETADLYKTWCKGVERKDYKGVLMTELDEIERHLNINVNVYVFDSEDVLMALRRSETGFESTLNILNFKNHFC